MNDEYSSVVDGGQNGTPREIPSADSQSARRQTQSEGTLNEANGEVVREVQSASGDDETPSASQNHRERVWWGSSQIRIVPLVGQVGVPTVPTLEAVVPGGGDVGAATL